MSTIVYIKHIQYLLSSTKIQSYKDISLFLKNLKYSRDAKIYKHIP